jgi:hypothetical protein
MQRLSGWLLFEYLVRNCLPSLYGWNYKLLWVVELYVMPRRAIFLGR